jgi:hypothetical protein
LFAGRFLCAHLEGKDFACRIEFHRRGMSDQITKVNEVFLYRLSFARSGAFPFADEFLRGDWHGCCPFASFYNKNGHNESRYEKAICTTAYINKLATFSGLTQFRLRFKLDDNNNAIANTISFFSGNSATNKPILTIQYYVP